jgi:hypothetical protein
MTSFNILRRRIPTTNVLCALSQVGYYPKGLVEQTPVVQGFGEVRIVLRLLLGTRSFPAPLLALQAPSSTPFLFQTPNVSEYAPTSEPPNL